MLHSRLLSRGRGLCAILVVVGLVLCIGCSDGGGYSGPSGTVDGTVTLGGDPVPQGCRVTFISEAGFVASGEVGAAGAYTLSVIGKDGSKSSEVPVATYQVSVSEPASEGGSEADYDAAMEASAAGEGQAEAEQAEAEVIPAKYQSAGTSELSFEVKEGPNPINIELQ